MDLIGLKRPWLRSLLRLGRGRCHLSRCHAKDIDDEREEPSDEPPRIQSNWQEFRAKLSINDGHSPSQKGLRAAEASLRRLSLDHPELAAEAQSTGNGLWCISTGGVPEMGGLLIARKGVTSVDKRFEESVFLIIERGSQGTIALHLDRPTALTFGKGGPTGMPMSLGNAPDYVQATFRDNRLYCGGYLSQHIIFLIHGSKLGGSVEIAPGVFMGGELAAAAEVAAGRIKASDFKFFAGAVVWDKGELEKQIDGMIWYTASASRALILRQTLQLSTPLWKEMLWLMGPDYAREAGLGDEVDEGDSDEDEGPID